MGNRLAAHIRAGEWKVTDLRQGYRFLFGPVQLPVPRTDPVPVTRGECHASEGSYRNGGGQFAGVPYGEILQGVATSYKFFGSEWFLAADSFLVEMP